MMILYIVVALAVLTGCQTTRTPHDDIRSMCVTAAHTHQLMTSWALSGRITADEFAAIDEIWDTISADCMSALRGYPVPLETEGKVREFNARYGEPASNEER